MPKLEGVKKFDLMNWMLIALMDAESRGLTIQNIISELHEQIRLSVTEQELVKESGRY